MSSKSNTIAFLGATGGCTLQSLISTLQCESPVYQAVCLARTPAKLTTMLRERGIPDDVLSNTDRLVIVQGDAREEADVKKFLQAGKQLPAAILSGIGGSPVFKPAKLGFGLDDPNVCESAITALLSALRSIRAENTAAYTAPYLSAISSTGIDSTCDDVPLLLKPVYAMLHEPHLDKRCLERTIEGIDDGIVSGWTIVRPTLFVDGEKGSYRVGWVGSKENPVPKGMSVGKGDVGKWIFENIVKVEPREEIRGQKVVIAK